MNQPYKLPKRILIIGLLFIVYGVWNLVDTLYHLAHFQLSLSFEIFTLPVGIGLISGKSSSRWWGRSTTGISLISFAGARGEELGG